MHQEKAGGKGLDWGNCSSVSRRILFLLGLLVTSVVLLAVWLVGALDSSDASYRVAPPPRELLRIRRRDCLSCGSP